MSVAIIQAPSLILPQYYVAGTEHEDILDLVCHISREFYIADIQEKKVSIVAIENVAVAAPGNLWWWIELSPVLSTTSVAYWVAIGGGGNVNPATLLPYIAPMAPNIIVGTGVLGTPHTDMIAWTMHSAYARVVVQCPVNAGLANPDYWQVQVIVSGKTP